MDSHEFITGIESWGSGGTMLDLVTLKDGSILMIADGAIVLYSSRDDFECGRGGRTLRSFEDADRGMSPGADYRPHLRAVS
jgi:hypothetical protein